MLTIYFNLAKFKILATYEEDNVRLYEENIKLKQALEAVNIDKDRTSVNALINGMKEKDIIASVFFNCLC